MNTENAVEQASALAQRMARWLSEDGVDLATRAVAALAIFLAGWLVIKLVDSALRKALNAKKRKTLMTDFVASVVTKCLWAILAVTVLGKLGVDVAPLVAGLGVTGFILGFAFQESLGNLASGLMIAINEPFKVGDFIEAAGLQGSVVKVDMMATVLSTPDNKRIVAPNKSVWDSPIVNYSAMDVRRVDMQIGIAYGEDIERAIDIIRETVAKVPGVLAEPAPAVATGALAESQVTVNVRPWAKTADYWSVYSATLSSVKRELAKNGVEIPFPQLVVHKV